jgi:hypothetical protein
MASGRCKTKQDYRMGLTLLQKRVPHLYAWEAGVWYACPTSPAGMCREQAIKQSIKTSLGGNL